MEREWGSFICVLRTMAQQLENLGEKTLEGEQREMKVEDLGVQPSPGLTGCSLGAGELVKGDNHRAKQHLRKPNLPSVAHPTESNRMRMGWRRPHSQLEGI